MTKPDPFNYFKTSREIFGLAVMIYIRFPLSLCLRLLRDTNFGSA